MAANLYLIPTPLGNSDVERVITQYNIEIIAKLRIFIVEDVRTSRRFLSKIGLKEIISESIFFILNEHTKNSEAKEFLAPIYENKSIGLLSEAGTPCIADPGNIIVKLAHENGIKVVPLSGPSSIFLALMASGLNGQNFAFNGYLPIKPIERQRLIVLLEKNSYIYNQTQIFIETPYRNNQLLSDLLKFCNKNTLLSVSTDITLESEEIYTKTISEWEKFNVDFNKRLCIFMILKN